MQMIAEALPRLRGLKLRCSNAEHDGVLHHCRGIAPTEGTEILDRSVASLASARTIAEALPRLRGLKYHSTSDAHLTQYSILQRHCPDRGD